MQQTKLGPAAIILASFIIATVPSPAGAQENKQKSAPKAAACTFEACLKLQTSRGWPTGEAGPWCSRHLPRGDACQ